MASSASALTGPRHATELLPASSPVSTTTAPRTGGGALLLFRLIVQSLRPEQWTKNLVVFAALIFGQRLFDPAAVAHAVAAFCIFCAVSGAVYLFNDVSDRSADQAHPTKRLRPIASGLLGTRPALAAAGVLVLLSLVSAFWLQPAFAAIVAAYLALFVAYARFFKHVVIVDVLTIAIGFVLRAAGGAVVVAVPMSQWLLVCTILLALFLGLSKRRHELTLLSSGATGHRRILEEYSPYLLDQMIAVVTASTLMAYIIYCTSADTTERFGTTHLALTTPFPIYGIFRYLYLVHQKGAGSPSEVLLTDRPLVVCIALWALAVVMIIYRPVGL